MTISKSNIIGWSGFVIMFLLFLLQRSCNSNHVCETSIKDSSTTITWDTTPREIEVPVPVPYPVAGKERIIKVPADVDTAFILQKYFNEYYYSQTISDSNLRVTISDTVTENKIKSRKFTYQILKPTTITTVINKPTPKPRMDLYMGGFADGKIDGTNIGIGFSVSLKTKKEIIYRTGFDVINQRALFGVEVTLRKKK